MLGLPCGLPTPGHRWAESHLRCAAGLTGKFPSGKTELLFLATTQALEEAGVLLPPALHQGEKGQGTWPPQWWQGPLSRLG